MKTKKEIMQWWWQRGKLWDGSKDLKDFWQKIDCPITYKRFKDYFDITCLTAKSKYPIWLRFHKGWSINISGYSQTCRP